MGFLSGITEDLNGFLGNGGTGGIFEKINGLVSGVGGVAKNAVGQGAGVVGSGIGGLLSNPYILIGGAIALIIIIK